MSVSALDFGTTRKGQPIHLYRMRNTHGMEVDVCDVGASIVAVRVPTDDGRLVDVALGFDEAHRYEHNEAALGGIVGRCANRIAGASLTLDGRTFHLTPNDGDNTLHGGCDMWFERLWDSALIGRKGRRRKGTEADTVTFGLLSPDGDQGFPGDVDVRVTYQLTDEDELAITYDAQPTLMTAINLTSHAYWNLNGHDAGSVLDHTLRVRAHTFTPTGDDLIPDGTVADVCGTPLDFRVAKPMRQATDELGFLDHNFVVGTYGHSRHVATLTGEATGITLRVFSDLPAIQVYAGGKLNVEGGKDGAAYQPCSGIALETQFCPDALHHEAFEQSVFTPERPFQSRTVLRFSQS